MATLLGTNWDSVLRLKHGYSFQIALFLYCVYHAADKYATTKNMSFVRRRRKPRAIDRCDSMIRVHSCFCALQFQVHGFVYSVMASFGGGIIVPVLINHSRVPFPLGNDIVIPFVFVTFYVTRAQSGWREFVGRPGVRHAIACGFEVMRATIILNWTRAALEAITGPSTLSWLVPGQSSFVGAITCGTMAGCGGAFMPLDKGLAPLKGSGVPWGVTSAFLCACFYVVCTSAHLVPAVNVDDASASVYCALFLVACRLQIMTASGLWAAGKKKAD